MNSLIEPLLLINLDLFACLYFYGSHSIDDEEEKEEEVEEKEEEETLLCYSRTYISLLFTETHIWF